MTALRTIPNDIEMPRALLFDWDNTLVDNWESIRTALNAAFVAFGLETWTLAETKARVRESMRDRFPRMFGARWEDARDIFYETFRESHLRTLDAMPGAEEMLRGLAEKDLYLGVVSNKNGELLRKEAAYLGWDSLFSRLVGAADARRDKPATDPVTLALESSGIEAGLQVWFVGDAAIDMECARASGCRAVLVGGDKSEAGFDTYPPDMEIPDCLSLLSLVRNLAEPHMGQRV